MRAASCLDWTGWCFAGPNVQCCFEPGDSTGGPKHAVRRRECMHGRDAAHSRGGENAGGAGASGSQGIDYPYPLEQIVSFVVG